jgi:hypothetical protein
MTAILNIVLPILAIVCFLAVVIFAARALRARTRSMHQAYGVGQQELRQEMLVNFLRSFVALILGLVFLGLFGLAPDSTAGTEPNLPTSVTPEVVSSPTTALVLTPTMTIALSTIETSPTPLPTFTAPPPTATFALTATVALTTTSPVSPTTSGLPTATVNSGVGVYLRAEASTTAEQLEYLVDGTIVTLLPGRQTAEGFEWAQVRTAEGLEGWVVLEFLVVNQP